MELTQEYVKSLFDYREGVLYWKADYHSSKGVFFQKGTEAGYLRKRPITQKQKDRGLRRVIYFNGKNYIGSRITFLWHKGYLPRMVDHENRISHDDMIENLRPASYSENNKNKSPKINGSSKYLGVSWCNSKNKWAVYITVNKKSIYAGRFNCEDKAALRYNQVAVMHHREFASLNIIKPN